ncbi:MAG TPA: UDP-3-O-(3-hydroxymyristoyl)glucosamine N-acyltransferase [Woeseiaceae bacterium]|nr:UDP-3-O-(3-hydroxymyristoyl)glucosamine N-acyltransferase [Woeseiaceae bacterium]
MRANLGDLATRFGCEVLGDPARIVTHVATLANADGEALSFFSNPAYRAQLQKTSAGAVVLRPGDAGDCPVPVLLAADPYVTFARIAGLLHPPEALPPGIHPTAVVDRSASVDASAHVAAHTVIGPNSIVGPQAAIGANTVVGPRCRIGRGTRLHANVTLVQDVVIGECCIVHPGAVIGSDGFGNARDDTGWVKVPQIGGVVIGNDVEVGANTTIDRGAIEDTVIGDGVRLDNLIQIAHNVRLGEHTAMASLSGISGSTVVGKRCLFGGQSGVVGHITICDDVIVGGATMISKDIREPGFYTGSFPAEKDKDWKRKVGRFRRLEDLARRIRKLEGESGP